MHYLRWHTWIHLKVGIDYLQEIKESGTRKKCWAGRKTQIAAARVTWAGLIMPTSTLLMTSAYSIYFVQNMYILCTEYLAHDLGLFYVLCTEYYKSTLHMTSGCSTDGKCPTSDMFRILLAQPNLAECWWLVRVTIADYCKSTLNIADDSSWDNTSDQWQTIAES